MPPIIFHIEGTESWERLAQVFGCFPILPWSTISKIVRQQGCRTCLIERYYIDIDFRSEFAAFHSRKFHPGPSVTRRLHFFNSYIDDLNVDLPYGLQEYQDNYLGYCIHRPLEQYSIGRTLIVPPSMDKQGYITCHDRFPAHLGGDELYVGGTPFIQQDGMVIRCAQACMWMAARYMHQRHSFPVWLPADITEAATQHNHQERPLPSSGLIFEQVAHALHAYGLHPIAYRPSIDSTPVEMITSYVDSGIPVFCSIKSTEIHPRHAALIVGYVCSTPKELPPNPGTGLRYDLHNVSHYIVHDDELGPYLLLPITPSTDAANRMQRSDYIQERLSSDEVPQPTPYNFVDIEAFAVPLPWKVYLRAEHVMQTVEDMMPHLVTTLASSSKTDFAEKHGRGAISYRPLVIESETYKRWVFEDSGMHDGLKTLYRFLDLPRFIWVVEIIDTTLRGEHRVIGEILLDPTQAGFDRPWLAVHLPGEMTIRWVSLNYKELVTQLPQDPPHAHFRNGIVV